MVSVRPRDTLSHLHRHTLATNKPNNGATMTLLAATGTLDMWLWRIVDD